MGPLKGEGWSSSGQLFASPFAEHCPLLYFWKQLVPCCWLVGESEQICLELLK